MPSESVPLVGWDSCIIIEFLQGSGPQYASIRRVIQSAEMGLLRIAVANMASVEVLRVGDQADSATAEVIEDFFAKPYVVLHMLDHEIATLARDIRRRNRHVGAADAVHLATSLWMGAGAFLTTDKGGKATPKASLLALDGLLGTPPLRIMTPDDYCATNDGWLTHTI